MKTKRKGLTNAELRERGLKIASPDRVRADQEARRSSAGSPQDRGRRRARTRRDAKRAAVREFA